METKGGVTRSRDSKDFFEEKQLVTLRPNTRWRAIAEHAYLQRQMPSNLWLCMLQGAWYRYLLCFLLLAIASASSYNFMLWNARNIDSGVKKLISAI
ncbi:hypothetical protein NDU88_003997 [Pleurodeles waltl]|uniref:Uncharacterized protein n=1 Tax=Pleurodeles waltl TaxID=8319 RepID=A0AAV7PFF3_PLEWA|nr:hypothetical protein NDU88_003997 [Pleurodeles waltl]